MTIIRTGRLELALSRLLPGTKIIKHYVRPLLRAGRTQIPYEARSHFDHVYHRGVTDQITVSYRVPEPVIRYHYNAVENSIIEALRATRLDRPAVLDIGAGAGHWIDFYRDVYRAGQVVGVDISAQAAAYLSRKYRGVDGVRIVQGDVSRPGFDLGRRFDLISAVGVMFHVVDDRAWQRTLCNLAAHLSDDGVIVIGGQFGRTTQNVQVEPDDSGRALVVNKRIRSLRYWRRVAQEAGLRVVGLQRTRQVIATPENHILILRREA